MPFGKWKDFNSCVSDMKRQGKGANAAAAICGKLQNNLGGAVGEMAAAAIEEVLAYEAAGQVPPQLQQYQKQRGAPAGPGVGPAAPHQTQGLPCPKGQIYDKTTDKCVEDPNAPPSKAPVAPQPQQPPQQKAPPQAPQQQQAPQQPSPDQQPPSDTSNPFDQYTDFEDCLNDQINQQGLKPEDGVKTCSGLLLDYIKMLRENPDKAIPPAPTGPQQMQNMGPKGGAIVDSFGNNDHFFIKTFLLSADTNVNRWGVTTESLPHNIGSFIGKPLVLTEDFAHPNLDDMNLSHAMEFQELFRIGNIIDITQKGNTYYAIVEVTDPYAKQALQSNAQFPIYVSPAINKLTHSEPDDQISNWTGIHLAIVDDPAYTVKHAQITGQCSGAQQQCLLQLKKAHVEKHGYGSCGFCAQRALMSRALPPNVQISGTESPAELRTIAEQEWAKIADQENKIAREALEQVSQSVTNNTDVPDSDTSNTSYGSTEGVSSSVDILQETPAQNNANTQVPNNNTSTGSGQKLQHNNVSVHDSGAAAYTQELETLKAKVEALTSSLSIQQSERQRLEAENNQLKNETKKKAIENIVTADIIQDPERRAARVQELLNSGLSIDAVEGIYHDLKEQLSNINNTNPNMPPQFAPQPVTYQAQTKIKNAAVEQQSGNNNGEMPSWLQTRDQIIHRNGGKNTGGFV